MNPSYQLQTLLQPGTASVAMPPSQPQEKPRRLLDYRSWLCMQPASWAKPQPSKFLPRKPKRVRTGFTTSQLNELETEYAKYRFLSQPRRMQLANRLQLKEHTIKIWFQNRRMKEKRELAEAQESFGDVYEAVPQPMLYYTNVAQTYPVENVPSVQNCTSEDYDYSHYMHGNNELFVSPSNVQESPEPHVLPHTQTEITSLGSTKEEIIQNLFLIEQQYMARHTVPSPTEDEHSSPYFNPERSCMYGDTTPFASIPEQHDHSKCIAYPDSEENLSIEEQLIPLLDSQEVTTLGYTKEEIIRNLFLLEQQYKTRQTGLAAPTDNVPSPQHFISDPSRVYEDKVHLETEGRPPAAVQPTEHIPGDLIDVPCSTYFEDVDINNYF
ncbi:hypothetical protein HF086_003534 [Spodoptera exigua]|uniref:Homeobox domain-containing protein n=1 Tax=Spodoptera exigua TaxID=7107 RepID=A0A922SCD5_SPOEX|nr:hypothetical protein HF086_003534 [Spodoptera exigua]